MKQTRLSILLMFIMLVTPIASAFEHCVGMDILVHLPESQSFSVSLLADAAIPLEHKKMLKGMQSNQIDKDCHNNTSCTFHVCGTYSITSAAPIINPVSLSCYSTLEYASLYSTILSPDLRPPIFIL